MRRILLGSTLLLAFAAPTMAATIYKWVDEKGVTQFSAQPPEQGSAQRINPNIPRPPTSAPSTAPANAAETPATNPAETPAQSEPTTADTQAAEARRQAYCKDLRNNLVMLQSNPRIREEVDGEPRRLGEDERQARIEEVRKALQENCK